MESLSLPRILDEHILPMEHVNSLLEVQMGGNCDASVVFAPLAPLPPTGSTTANDERGKPLVGVGVAPAFSTLNSLNGKVEIAGLARTRAEEWL